MSTSEESVEFSDEDLQDLRSLGVSDGELPQFHTILEVWREVLKPAHTEAEQRPTPQWANKLLSSYQGISFHDMYEIRDRYFAKLYQLEDLLLAEIATDEDCLTYTSPEEDVENNSGHYRNLLQDWQLTFLDWELDWDARDEHAAAELAAISEVYKIMFGDTGLTAFLDNIKFQFTEQDQAALQAALQERKAEQ